MNSTPAPLPTSRSVLLTYCNELERLASTIYGVLDVAERRSDLSAAEDAQSIARLTELVDGLAKRFARFRGSGSAGSGPATARESAARTGGDPRFDALASPAVQASVAETVGSQFGHMRDEFRDWLDYRATRRPVVVGDLANCAAKPASASPAAVRGGPLEAEQLLPTLLEVLDGSATMKGTAATMAMPLVFDFLVRLKRTGCLHIRTTNEHLRFVFAEGMIVATATDNQPNDQYLGEILRHLGLMPRRHIQTLVARAERDRKPLGRLLVEDQFLSLPQLSKALTIQVQARFERAFRAGAAAYAFVPNAGERIDDRICVNARALLADLQQRSSGGSDETRAPSGSPEPRERR